MIAPRRITLLVALLALRPPAPGAAADVLTLPTDPRTAGRLEAARDALKARDWRPAVVELQRLLDGDEEALAVFALPGPDGREVRRYVAVRAEARRLLAEIPAEGRQVYQALYGRDAADLLAKARKDKDAALRLRIVQRYPLTAAGVEALQELADAVPPGQPCLTAAHYDLLRRRHDPARWTSASLFRAALAFRAAGSPAADVEKELLARAGAQGLRIDQSFWTAEQLKAELEKSARTRPADEWRMFGGDAGRSAPAAVGIPILERAAAMPLVEQHKSVGDRITAATAKLQADGRPLLPPFFPIAANGPRAPLVCYRTYWGIHAYDIAGNKLYFKTPADGSLEKLLGTSQSFNAVNSWLDWYTNKARRPSVLLENSTVGTLSTDGNLLFVVDDLAVPPPPELVKNLDVKGPREYNPYPSFTESLKNAIRSNKLRAYSMAAGKLIWEEGAPWGREKGLHDCHFLGPPLPLDDRLFVLTEKDQEFRLVTLDARFGKLLAVCPVGAPRTKLVDDPLRRMEAALPAYADGVLVCPTNAGALLGIDLLSGTLRWAYCYGDAAPAGPDNPDLSTPALWAVSAPVVRDGKVVFTARDGAAVYCVNLQDGTPVWTHTRRKDDLYLAGVGGGRVLIVGTKSLRALSLDRGEQVFWTAGTGTPSGRGVFGPGGRYYLPLAASAAEGKPGIAVVDPAGGNVSLIHSAPKEVPGNLLFFDGKLICQTATELVVYPLR